MILQPTRMRLRRLGRVLFAGAAGVAAVAVAGSAPAAAEDYVGLYQASWAGMAAGQIRLTLHDEPQAYRSEIGIRTEGLPRMVTRFRGSAAAAGQLTGGNLPQPAYYDAQYDLRKRKNRRLSMRFAGAAATRVAERGPDDTSTKPPLADQFRRNIEDPLSALAAIRDALRHGRRDAFTVPVYDGARRFDIAVRVVKKTPGKSLDLELTLRPIAGFKGETSEDGDPDDAPRPVSLTLTDDASLMPVSMSVSLYYMPLVVDLVQRCRPGESCGW